MNFHILRGQVERSATILQHRGAAVTMLLHPGMGHTVNPDEIELVKTMLQL